MKPVWPQLAKMHLNTVLTGMSWAQFEPEEGKYDYALVDDLLAGARQQNLKVIFVWFGSWKNGISSFAPAWIKAAQNRFPRAQLGSGRSIEVLSTLSRENLKADSNAYKAFMHHLRDVDSDKHTVIMIQIENEVGVLGDSRDRSAAANEAFAQPVPKQLVDYLQMHRTTLRPELKKVWDANGNKTSGSWAELFGTAMADEIFMAWNYARYMNEVTKTGKTEYPVPVFTNTWIVQPEDRGPGDYPSGCPEPHVLDIWRAGGPDIDINAPDIYLPNFAEWVARFHQNGNPLFVPESRGDAAGVANAFYAIGQHDAIGYSPFGIDNVTRLLPASTGPAPSGPVEAQGLPLAKGYDILGQLAPLILKHQGMGSIGAVLLNPGELNQTIAVGNYNVTVSKVQNRRSTAVASTLADASPTYAMIVATAPDEYAIAASNAEITFTPNTPGPPVAGLAQVQAGHYADGLWVPGRWLNGDDVLLNYKLAEAAATNQSGSGLRFALDGPTIQSVKLYRYK
jgi:beta-galactosidase GanA